MSRTSTVTRIPKAAERKFRKVAKAKRWAMTTTIDEAADALMTREGLVTDRHPEPSTVGDTRQGSNATSAA